MKGVLVAVVVLALVAGAWYFTSQVAEAPAVGDSEVVVQPAGGAKPAPQVPAAAPVYENASADLIVVDSPAPGAVVGHVFSVTGRARGQWYFEADFPLEVVSARGDVLTQVPATAQGNWMTTEFVPFSAALTIPATYSGPLTLILHNHNASGLPEHERSLSIPVVVRQ